MNTEKIIETNLPIIWNNMLSSYELDNGYLLSVDGRIFKFFTAGSNYLMVGELFAHGIKLCDTFLYNWVLNHILYQDKYIISIANIESEFDKIINKIRVVERQPFIF